MIDFIVLWPADSLWLVTQSIVVSCIWPNFQLTLEVWFTSYKSRMSSVSRKPAERYKEPSIQVITVCVREQLLPGKCFDLIWWFPYGFNLWQTLRDPRTLENSGSNSLIFPQKRSQITQNSLVNISLWVIVTIIKALSFENIMPLCLCDLSTSERHYRKRSNFTKLLCVFFDLKTFILSSPWF